MPPKRQYRKKQGLTKGQSKQVKAIAQSVVNNEIEDKEAIFERIERNLVPAIPTGNVSALPAGRRPNDINASYFNLLPDITQSISGQSGRKYNTRIGNEIILKSIHLKGFLEYSQDYATQALAKNQKILVRLMVLSQKRSGNFTTAYTNISNRMMRTATNADENTGPFTGSAINGVQDINRDVFTQHYSKTFYMTAPTLLQGGATGADVDVAVNPSTLKFFNKKLTFGGKTGMKLKFANSSADVPENFAPFIVVGYSSLSANQVPSEGLVRMTYNVSAVYQDA